MGDDQIFFKIKSFSNISQNPFDYKDDPNYSYNHDGSFITIENDEIKLNFNSKINTKYFDKKTGEKLDFAEFNVLKMMSEGNLEPILKKMEGAHQKTTYSNWNLELLTVKKKTSLSGLGEYIGYSSSQILKEFPNVYRVKENYLCYANVPEYCFIAFYFKDDIVVKITFLDDYY